MDHSRHVRPVLSIALWCCGIFGALAQTAASVQPFVEEQRQQERQRALREKQERSVHATLPTVTAPAVGLLPVDETPCFDIETLALDGPRASEFSWLLVEARYANLSGQAIEDKPQGRCLGTQGVNVVLARLQQALIARGWITTRVLTAPQDLRSGILRLTLVPGRIAAIRFVDGESAASAASAPRTSAVEGLPDSLRHALPMQAGDLLNLRDVEQGLENLKRLPTADADIQIEPSQAPGASAGDSDLVVRYRQKFPLRVNLSLDDSGTRNTGKTQAGITLSWDGPLQRNDLAYLNLSHDIWNPGGRGTQAVTVHYDMPFGNWLLGATASQNEYHQTVAGASQQYVFSGQTRQAEVKLERLLYRDQHHKTTAYVRGFRRASNNYIDDTEIEVQRRTVSGWELGLGQRMFLGDATVELNGAHRRGTGAFGALPAPEQLFDEGTARYQLWTADARVNVPFKLAAQHMRYTGQWRAQWNHTPLSPQDGFAIGGRYSVRGFDGETSLLGDRGWWLRNDLGWSLPSLPTAVAVEAYLGVDIGAVGGRMARQLSGQHLAGALLGLRGNAGGMGYDIFVGTPLRKPPGYTTASTTFGFSLNFSF
ncbi:ShlB/FhaC/HecB family hemolysin secretion/activation protein [Variovorax sp. HJSM1_2]|uniref:ShlB/FhaC/HecB family hemolysin secretion/activation protein n=1 Tax=Variovorax sp. HJSM1_2 TaxID=3366263 RepID=UPI003BBE62E4